MRNIRSVEDNSDAITDRIDSVWRFQTPPWSWRRFYNTISGPIVLQYKQETHQEIW